jgi:NADH:ubiquinone oxidoreductase subunit 4 (subunit M)
MAFLGMAVFQYYFAVFLGPMTKRLSVGDLKLRERVALFGLLALLIGFGVFPRWIVRSMGTEVGELGGVGQVRDVKENAALLGGGTVVRTAPRP